MEMDLALNNQQWLICLKTKPNQTKPNHMFNMYVKTGFGINVGWLFEIYDISTFVGYLMPNPFLYKSSVLFQTTQFSISMQFKYQNSSSSNNSV